MVEEYKFSTKILEDQEIEAKVGIVVDLQLGPAMQKVKILKIEKGEVFVEVV